MNHKMNAIFHKLPECPECGAAALQPCVISGSVLLGSQPRSPHAIRQKMVDGLVFVITPEQAKRKGMLRAIRELAGVSLAAAKQKP